ncbi:biopolymer transporter ExbD [Salinisphaera sp.]|uniref:ExbD/TolR family protein n=1 Tax=Salinisphaera sp. TaxID=1914330 RepID=UPI002D768B1C|nr:biopolymer transporter ExbD [Salinisphaera sp.]HET7314946.1 biopolymer transporter ExbD [Salinisphaera sp.]
MRFKRARAPATSAYLDDAILPLANVVFLLLIFFMLAGHLATPSPINVQPPRSASQASAERQGIEVALAADGRLAVGGHTIDKSTLETVIKRRLKATPDAPIRLRADGDLATNRVVRIMQILRKAGVHRLRLITRARTQ